MQSDSHRIGLILLIFPTKSCVNVSIIIMKFISDKMSIETIKKKEKNPVYNLRQLSLFLIMKLVRSDSASK